jgi:regulator of nucleoside diphosphate kinase
MRAERRFLLTPKDVTILRAILDRDGQRGDPVMAMVRDKLSRADVISPEEIDARIVTLNSRVEFKINDGALDTRVLVNDHESTHFGMTIPVVIPRGLALLGVCEGEEVVVAGFGGRPERIYVHRVAYQPEAANRHSGLRRVPDGSPRNASMSKPTLDASKTGSDPVVVNLASWRDVNGSIRRSDPGDDGPGPSVA